MGTGIVSIDIMGFLPEDDYKYLCTILVHDNGTMGKVDFNKLMRSERPVVPVIAAGLATMPHRLPVDLRYPVDSSRVSLFIMHEPIFDEDGGGGPQMYPFSFTVESGDAAS